MDKYDYHLVGLNEEFLAYYLLTTGFIEIHRVADFGLFQDTSRTEIKNVRISLNMLAVKPSST